MKRAMLFHSKFWMPKLGWQNRPKWSMNWPDRPVLYLTRHGFKRLPTKSTSQGCNQTVFADRLRNFLQAVVSRPGEKSTPPCLCVSACPTCPVKRLPNEMRSIFHRGGACLSGMTSLLHFFHGGAESKLWPLVYALLPLIMCLILYLPWFWYILLI